MSTTSLEQKRRKLQDELANIEQQITKKKSHVIPINVKGQISLPDDFINYIHEHKLTDKILSEPNSLALIVREYKEWLKKGGQQ